MRKTTSREQFKQEIQKLIHDRGMEQILAHLIENIESCNIEDELYLKRLAWDLRDTLKHYKDRYET